MASKRIAKLEAERVVAEKLQEERAKIGLFCNIDLEAVIEERDKDFSIYEVPLSLVHNGLDELIVKI